MFNLQKCIEKDGRKALLNLGEGNEEVIVLGDHFDCGGDIAIFRREKYLYWTAYRGSLKNLPPKTFTLELTEDEGHFLRSILARIGGEPEESRRCLADSIADALDDISGIGNWDTSDLSGEIYCK